jgi:hypothetical protein
MRNRTAALLIALLCVVGVAACGDDDSGSDAAPSGTDSVVDSPSDGDGTSAGVDDTPGDSGEEPTSETPLPTVPVNADLAAAATANARLIYPDVLPEGALAEEIDGVLGTMCPIATDTSVEPAAAAQAIVDIVPTDAGPPRSVPAMIMVAGRYLVDDGCGTSPHIDLVAGELHELLGVAVTQHQ